MPLGLVTGGLLLLEFYTLAASWKSSPGAAANIMSANPQNISNALALGSILYTQYVFAFQMSGLVLLVAMIGAIALTLKHKPDARRQNIGDQLARKPSEAMTIRKVVSGAGVD